MATKKAPAKKLVMEYTPPKKTRAKKKPHLFVATPMYGGMTTGFFCQSLIPLPGLLKEKDIDVSFSFMFNESLIQRARNGLVHGFMQRKECTHLMFIDADIRFSPADIISMMEADKDVICGIYPKKEINWTEVDKAVKLCLNHPMGPLELCDLAGADVVMHGLETMYEEFGERLMPAPLLKNMVRSGDLGRKTGRGFYDYPQK